MIRVKDIMSGVEYRSDEDLSGMPVKDITNDSRKVLEGGIFIAVRGAAADGYKFIGDAVKKGAALIVSDRDFDAPEGVKKILVKDALKAAAATADNFYGHPSKKIKLAGVTGTNGKTTITYLVENILLTAGKDTGVIGTINYRIKGEELPSGNTTPGQMELQSLLARMLKGGVRHVVMEVSSHALDQGRLGNILFDAAIFTNVTKEHLDYHETVENYFNAKAKLFEKLKNGGAAILNNDDKLVRGLKNNIRTKCLTYGIENESDITAKDLKLSIDSSNFTVKTPEGDIAVRTGLIGRHNVSNILASAAAALALGINLKTIKKGIESFRSVPGRLELIDAGQPFRIFVDYAHTEDALYNVLTLLKEVTKRGNIITVFGCGGNRDRTKRPLMGNVACALSDKVIITSDNPRFEDPLRIISEIEAGVKGKFTNYNIVEDRRRAIAAALKAASKDDVVVIAGKGHEKCQIVGDKIIPFDDCRVTRSILCKLKK